MFYRIIRTIARAIICLLNGHLHVHGKENLPDSNYILVAPHRTWFEPVLFALAASPRTFMFMAKVELFKNPILRFILVHAHAFPVDRKHPGPSVVKVPIKGLKRGNDSLMLFPSGTRHSAALKGGVLLIARLSKKPVVPVIYQGPLTFKALLKRQPLNVCFGKPVALTFPAKMTKEAEAAMFSQIEQAWDDLDAQQNPNFHYTAK